MVTHIVLWNLKDKTQKAQQGGEMKRRLEALVGVVPGLSSAHSCTGGSSMTHPHKSRS